MTVDTYIESLNEPQKSIMLEIRRRMKETFPDALEAVSYGVPAFLKEKSFFYYGAFKAHVSVFPPLSKDSQVALKTKPYQNKKGNLLFKVTEEIPYDLIIEVAKALYKQY